MDEEEAEFNRQVESLFKPGGSAPLGNLAVARKRYQHMHKRADPSEDLISKRAWKEQGRFDCDLHKSLGPAHNEKGNTCKLGWLYKLVNTVNGKAYVGQTRKQLLAKRMDGHRTAHRRQGMGCRALNAAIVKYGWNAFRLEVLGRVPCNKLDEMEENLINEHGTLAPGGYNILSGATLVPMHDPEVRARRAKTMLNESPRRRIAVGVRNARQNRPDWEANVIKARRERAARERAAKMADMTEEQAKKYLKRLNANAVANAARQRGKRTSC
tara:strand:+ start:2459 stop:3268 length:810 start_codon:yes stop_codon:yes gene_type:complete